MAGSKPSRCSSRSARIELAAAGHHERVPDGVVLLLVQLARLGVGGQVAGLVHRRAHLQQGVGFVPTHQLGPGQAGVGPEGLEHQGPHGVGLQRHIVVAQQVEGRPFDHGPGLVHRGAEAHVLLGAADIGSGQHRSDPGLGVLGAGGVDHQHRQALVGLVPQRRQALLEPRSRVVADHHRHHCGKGFGSLAVGVRASTHDRETVVARRRRSAEAPLRPSSHVLATVIIFA